MGLFGQGKIPLFVKREKSRQHQQRGSIDMDLFFLSVVVAAAVSSSHQLLCSAGDILEAGQSISGNQTLVSAGQIFALGFFNPGNSTAAHLYAGIWYNRLPGKRAVVWVANRESPLRDPAGVLTVTEDGNMAVLDGAGGVIWSTNLSDVPSNTSAVLLDSGNLVLRHGEGEEGYVWESFEHPTDTVLQGMVMRSNVSSGAGTRLTSWRGAADPSTGEFVFTTDPKKSLQFCLFKGSETYWRGRVWDGKPTYAAQLNGDLTSLYTESVVMDGDELEWTFYMVDSSMLGRYVLDYEGTTTLFSWDNRLQSWISRGSRPAGPCEIYNRCGPFGVCVSTETSCRCSEGFEPRNPEDWKRGNFTEGCTRRHQLRCDGTDRFVKLTGTKLPDRFSAMWNKSMEQCEAECTASCRCQAYAHTIFTSLNRTLSRCLIWLGEMTDVAEDPLTHEDLYLRLPASELEDNNNNTRLEDGVFPDKNKGLIKIILPILSFGMLLMGICCYFFVKRHKSTVGKRKIRQMVLSEGLDFSNTLENEKETPDVVLLDFKIVQAVTSNFCSANKLGEGGFGPVYKGRFLNGQEIAVKRLSKGSKQGSQEFDNEVRLIARLQHNNLVRLLGWCTHKDEKILIYEYMPNKSLDKFIFDPRRSVELNWEKRFRIMEGIANGLLYLHQHSRMRVIHRDLKTSNILLDSEMNPKISDFGLARIFQVSQVEANTQKVVGTYGYMSPEYAFNGVFSEKSDVFSFGVIMLEIITEKKSTGFYPYSNSQSLFGYAWQMWEEGRALELHDPSMCGSSSWATNQVLRCTQLAMLCIQEDAADRPTMSSILYLMNNDTCTLPMPKKPAFVIGRSLNPTYSSSLDRASKASINGFTESSVEGR